MPTVKVLDSYMAYTDSGPGGRPVVFLHGNPTSSHLWRNVIPYVAGCARCLAPDLIGMGASGKPGGDYRLAEHARYLEAWFDAMDLGEVVMVGHDWGGVLALDWASRHGGLVRGVALIETIVRPLTWEQFPATASDLFKAMRTPGTGERMVLEENFFIESALPASTLTTIADEDMNAYRAPYPDPESRRPLLQWPRELPLDGEPADVHELVDAYGRWLAESRDVPKLLMTAEPGSLVSPAIVEWCERNVASIRMESIGPAGHHAPEDRPEAIGRSIADWLTRLERPTKAGRAQ